MPNWVWKDAIKARTSEKLSMLSPKERKAAEMKIARSRRKDAKKAADLALLRKVEPNAKWSDLSRARRDGVIPSGKNKKAPDPKPKRVAKKQRVAYESSDESSLGDDSDED